MTARTPTAPAIETPAITEQNGLHEAQPTGAGEHGGAAPRRGETHGAAEGSTPGLPTAAPELLAALEIIANPDWSWAKPDDMREVAREALAKATP